MHATPWSLDELALPDAFPDFDAPHDADVEHVAMDAVDREEALRAHFTSERARAEADAYARGRDDGERATRTMLEQGIASAMSALSDVTSSMQVHEARWLANIEENIAALAVAVARHVVQREIIADPTFVRDLVLHAVTQYPVDRAITVRLHPEDLAACRTVLAAETTAIAHDIHWMADASIQRGGCLTEGRERIVDGRVDTALERAYRSLGGIQA